MSKETEKKLAERKKIQMDRLQEAYNNTYSVVYNKSMVRDDPARCKDYPDQCKK